jgi:hypothetical protein
MLGSFCHDSVGRCEGSGEFASCRRVLEGDNT